MSNTITTLSATELILKKHFAIPYYQRGYRWEQRHVEYLLNDIDKFIEVRNNSGSNSDYCLQPIVVTPIRDENNDVIWEVIDGQQRLITLYLIFKHIKKKKYQISFLARDKSTKFIQELNENAYSEDEPDFFYMSDAHRAIKKFFDGKLEIDPAYADEFYVTMKYVKVIWYELGALSEDAKIDIFNRLNIGKIPLTDAELIRALLLSKIKADKEEREGILRQTELSEEWNRIEHELREEEFWYFLNEKKHKNDASHIEFIFNLMAGCEAENYTTYLWFEKEINNEKPAKELWDRAKEIFGQLKSWYNRRSLYHYIGFLTKINPIKYSIQSLMEKQAELLTKSAFELWLKGCIQEEIKDIDLENLSYGSENIKKILLLFNVLTLNDLPDCSQNRFSFYRYKTLDGGWSIEHIHAQNSEELKATNQIKTWLKETKDVLIHIKTVEKTPEIEGEEPEILPIEIYIDEIDSLLSQNGDIDKNEFQKLKQELTEVFDSPSVHELSNLTLLGRYNNSSLKNFIFPVKRKKIIELEKQGHIIPLCTKMVFLKAYSDADNQPYYWSEKDKTAYFSEIERIINKIKK